LGGGLLAEAGQRLSRRHFVRQVVPRLCAHNLTRQPGVFAQTLCTLSPDSGREGEQKSNCPAKNFCCNKIVEKPFLFENFLSKNKIFGTYNFSCRNFATIFKNSVGKLQLITASPTF